jgi:hypothetical protein
MAVARAAMRGATVVWLKIFIVYCLFVVAWLGLLWRAGRYYRQREHHPPN